MSKGLPEEEAEASFDYYESCGWVIGKSQKPVKNWKACVRTKVSYFKKSGGELTRAKSEEDVPPSNWQKTFESLWPKRPILSQWEAMGAGDKKRIREYLERISGER